VALMENPGDCVVFRLRSAGSDARTAATYELKRWFYEYGGVAISIGTSPDCDVVLPRADHVYLRQHECRIDVTQKGEIALSRMNPRATWLLDGDRVERESVPLEWGEHKLQLENYPFVIELRRTDEPRPDLSEMFGAAWGPKRTSPPEARPAPSPPPATYGPPPASIE
jgi:hypothetical protein